jgi:hypothetical protein
MSAYTKFNSFVEAAMEKSHNLQADVLKVALCNTAPVAGNAVLADLTQIAYTNLSSRTISEVSSSQTGGTYTLVLSDLVLTSTGGSTGPFRYAAIYNDSATNKELIAFFDYGSSITLADGETLTLHFGANLFSLS